MVEGIPPQGLGGGWGRKAVLRGIWCCRLGRSVRVQGASAQAKLHKNSFANFSLRALGACTLRAPGALAHRACQRALQAQIC